VGRGRGLLNGPLSSKNLLFSSYIREAPVL